MDIPNKYWRSSCETRSCMYEHRASEAWTSGIVEQQRRKRQDLASRAERPPEMGTRVHEKRMTWIQHNEIWGKELRGQQTPERGKLSTVVLERRDRGIKS